MDGSAVIWASGITAFGALLLSVITAWNTRKKSDAEVNMMTSEEWRKLYHEMKSRIEKLEARIEKQDIQIRERDILFEKQSIRIDKMAHELDIAKDYIQYLWLGIVSLTTQLQEEGMVPVFQPKRNFRGDNDFDPNEWAWIGDK